MEKLKVGYASLSKVSFDVKWAEKIFNKSLKQLKFLNNIELVSTNDLILTEEDAKNALKKFKEEDIDVLLIQSATFHLGALPIVLSEELDLPIILWAVPEPPMNGDRLRANSLCAMNMNASALYKMRRRYKCIFGMPEKKEFLKSIKKIFKVLEVIKRLRKSKIGIIGYYRVPGFYDLAFDELTLRKVVGPEVLHIDLSEVYRKMDSLSKEDISMTIKKLTENVANIQVSKSDVEKAAKLYLSFEKIQEEYDLNAMAVKCWPEFMRDYGLAVCSTLGRLNDEGIPAGCEGDVNGTVTMLLGYYFTGKPSFLADLIAIDEKNNTGLVWHCGSAAPSLAIDVTKVTLNNYSIMKERDKIKGMTAEFPLKPGVVTFIRLSEKRNGNYRMLIIDAEAIKTEQILRGNPLKVKFKCSVKSVIKTILERGFEHHYVIIYGDLITELEEFCRWLDIEVVKP